DVRRHRAGPGGTVRRHADPALGGGGIRALPLRRHHPGGRAALPRPPAGRPAGGWPGAPPLAPGAHRRARGDRRRPSPVTVPHPRADGAPLLRLPDAPGHRGRGRRAAARDHGVPGQRGVADDHPRDAQEPCVPGTGSSLPDHPPVVGHAERTARAIRRARPSAAGDAFGTGRHASRAAAGRSRGPPRTALTPAITVDSPRVAGQYTGCLGSSRRPPGSAMSYKVYLWDALDAIEWSQAAWRIGGNDASTENCTVEMIHDVLLAHLPKDGLIVDAGCGTAKWPIYLGRAGYRCVGVEISHEACLAARAVDPTLRLVRADTRRAPLATGCADAVLSLGVVEHDEAGPEAGLRE